MPKHSENILIKKFYLKLCVAIPCIILFVLILFIYSSFQAFYVIPLIFDTYWFDNNPNVHLTQTQFPIFKEILRFEDQMIGKFIRFKSKEPLFSDLPHSTRGIIISLIIHYLLFWFLFSLIKTMKSDPGGTPDDGSEWALQINGIMDYYNQMERKAFRKIKKLKNKKMVQPNIIPNPQNATLDINFFNRAAIEAKPFLQPSLISAEDKNEDFKEQENDQGRQGTNSEKSLSPFVNESNELEVESFEGEFTEQEQILMNIRTLENAKREKNLRYCQHCRNFKPLRTHHCQQCMRCVLKMDHHCQWLLICIGFKNYKFFMNMLIYADLTLLFLVLTYTRCVMDVALNPYLDGFVIYIILLSYVLAVVLFCLIIGFSFFHFWLIFTAKTSLEYCEKWRKKEENEKNRLINFDEGKYKNFINVFNRNPFLWFLPFNINEEGNGLFEEFEIKNVGGL